MDLMIHTDSVTQHDLFGLFPGAPGGRALRDTYGHEHLLTIAAKGGRTTLERFGREYMKQLGTGCAPSPRAAPRRDDLRDAAHRTAGRGADRRVYSHP